MHKKNVKKGNALSLPEIKMEIMGVKMIKELHSIKSKKPPIRYSSIQTIKMSHSNHATFSLLFNYNIYKKEGHTWKTIYHVQSVINTKKLNSVTLLPKLIFINSIITYCKISEKKVFLPVRRLHYLIMFPHSISRYLTSIL